jgi:hypothetical protein
MNVQHNLFKSATLAVATVLLAAGTIGVLTTSEAMAEIRPALVRSVDEPARVPYAYSQVPSCPYANQCNVTFPAVPVGKRLRVTNVNVLMIGTGANGFVAINKVGTGPIVAFPAAPFNGAYYGNLISINEHVDLIFEAGETLNVEIGVPAGAGGVYADPRNRFGVTGYLVDVTP